MLRKMYSVVLIALIPGALCSMHMCKSGNNVDVTKGLLLSNGDVHFNGVKYDKSEYYFDDDSGTEKRCLCAKNTCVRKCCPLGLGYDARLKQCVNVTEVFDPPVWDEYRVLHGVNASEAFRFVFGKMNCTMPEWRIRVGQVTQETRLRKDGQLYVELPQSIPPWTLLGPDKYCIDTFMYEDPDGTLVTKLDALVCFKENQDDRRSYRVSSTCMLISAVFILATVFVYVWLPELRNMHGRVLIAYLLCLFVGFVFMSTMQILLLQENIGTYSCTWMTFVIYFFLLAAFFWLNVMCFDIWWTFSGKRGMGEKLSTRARFGAYAAYAFGVPTVLTGTLAALEFSSVAHVLMPNIRHLGCFLSGPSKLLYFYGPIATLCVANIVFFVLTALKITQIKQQTSVLKSKESARHDQQRNENDKQRLLLYVKLFVVMGVNWLLEVVSAIYPQADYVWMFTDAYNVLIGVTLFIIFVCKRKIFRLMKKRYKQMRGEPISRTQTVSSRTTSCRDDFRMNSVKAAP